MNALYLLSPSKSLPTPFLSLSPPLQWDSLPGPFPSLPLPPSIIPLTPVNTVSLSVRMIATASSSSRRHHCRQCLRLVCSACSSNTWQLDSGRGRGAAQRRADLKRVCDTCYAVLVATKEVLGLVNGFGHESVCFCASLHCIFSLPVCPRKQEVGTAIRRIEMMSVSMFLVLSHPTYLCSVVTSGGRRLTASDKRGQDQVLERSWNSDLSVGYAFDSERS